MPQAHHNPLFTRHGNTAEIDADVTTRQTFP
jgi:hypothetical protein